MREPGMKLHHVVEYCSSRESHEDDERQRWNEVGEHKQSFPIVATKSFTPKHLCLWSWNNKGHKHSVNITHAYILSSFICLIYASCNAYIPLVLQWQRVCLQWTSKSWGRKWNHHIFLLTQLLDYLFQYDRRRNQHSLLLERKTDTLTSSTRYL